MDIVKCAIFFCVIQKYAIYMHFYSNMETKKKKFITETAHYETSTFVIKMILGEL